MENVLKHVQKILLVSKEDKMKKLVVIQISLLMIFSVGFIGIFTTTDVYTYVQEIIVSTACLSCIKMDPVSNLEFVFDTTDGIPHPDFVLENLTKGVVFIGIREDICDGCDIMDSVLENLFDVEFGKEDTVYKIRNFDGTNVIFIHVSLDHSPTYLKDSFKTYDKDHIVGVPMFAVISLGVKNNETIPYYTTAYSTLNKNNFLDRTDSLQDVIDEAIVYYNEHSENYG